MNKTIAGTKKKNPAAVALGTLGGQVKVPKGFAVLSEEERAEKAREGAKARWGPKKSQAKKKPAKSAERSDK